MSDNEDSIPSQDKKRSRGKRLAVLERCKPILEHYYFRAGYKMSVDENTYAHAKLSVLYIYVNYNVIFLLSIILIESKFALYILRSTTPLNITR